MKLYTPATGSRMARLVLISILGGKQHNLEPTQMPRTIPSFAEVLAIILIASTVALTLVLLP